MINKLKYGAFVAFFCASFNLLGQFSPELVLDRDSIMIGEQIKMQLSISYMVNEAHDINWPMINDSIGDNIETIYSSKIDTIVDASDINLFTQSREIIITSFDTGYVVIPPFEFSINTKIKATDPILVYVSAPKVDLLNDFIGVGNIIEVEISWKDYLKAYYKWILIIIIIIVLLIVVIVLVKKHLKKKALQPSVKKEIVIIPHQLAFQKLEELKAQKLHQQGLVKEYYVQLTDILREYIEGRFDVLATDETSDEIIAELRKINIHKKDRAILRKTLTLADLVKFAKAKPSVFDHEECMSNAFVFVENTKEKEVEIEK